jgi:hypothetical protein
MVYHGTVHGLTFGTMRSTDSGTRRKLRLTLLAVKTESS